MASSLAMFCAVLAALVACLVGIVAKVLADRGVLVPGSLRRGVDLSVAPSLLQMEAGAAEVVATLSTPPGNIAVSSCGRVIFNFHPEYSEPSGAKFAEVSQGTWVPRFDLGAHVNTVLSLRIGASDRLYLLDFAFHGLGGSPKMVVFQLSTSASKDTFLMSYTFPSAVAGVGSMLNDFNLSPDEKHMYIADTSIVAGTPALVACAVDDMLRNSQDACRRHLQGHRSVLPEALDLSVNGGPRIVLAGLVHMRIGVDSIALDREGRWLYYAPVSSETLWRVPAAMLAKDGVNETEVEVAVERFSAKPITDGISVDDAGNVLVTAFEYSAVAMIHAGDRYEDRKTSVVLHDLEHLQWPDGLSFGPDRWLYVTSSALHHKFSGHDLTKGMFHIVRMRMAVGAAAGQ